MNYNDIRMAIKDACEKNKVPELSGQITFRFTRRMTSSAGNANYRTNVIKLSTIFWERASADDLNQTVYHEACHLIARYKARYQDMHGQVRYRPIQPHGWEWQAAMYSCGKRPERCHTVNMGKRNTHTVYCPCREHQVGPTRYKRMLRGTMNYKCRVCGGRLYIRPST